MKSLNMFRITRSLILLATCLSFSSASAELNIIYQGLDGFLRSDDSTGLLEPISGQTALAQLIFSPDNVADMPTVNGGVTGSEQILEERLITDSGGTNPYGALSATSFTDTFQVGFIYVRIYDQGTGLGGSGVVQGTWWYDGPIVSTIDNNTPANPDIYNAQGANPSVTFSGFGDFLNQQYVPEPSTIILACIGFAILRFRRLKQLN